MMLIYTIVGTVQYKSCESNHTLHHVNTTDHFNRHTTTVYEIIKQHACTG